jgi:hypothetical protein
MAALFYNNFTSDNTLFKDGIRYVSAVSLPFMRGLIGNSYAPIIVTSVGVQNRDTIQYFLTFDDVIHYFFFGKGLGNVAIQGVVLSNCDGDVNPGLNNLYNMLRGIRGTEVLISLGYFAFSAILSDFSTNTVADPVLMSEFTLNLNIIRCPALNQPLPRYSC